MTTGSRHTFEPRVRAALDHDPSRVPAILGLCGAGRTTLLRQLHHELGTTASQYVNVERTATTPERFLRALVTASPFAAAGDRPTPSTPREAFDAMLAFFAGARQSGGAAATFLLDEVMEFRTFESFPGLRHALADVLTALVDGPNRFVLASRYVTRAERALAAASPRFLAARVETLTAREVDGMLGEGALDEPPAGEASIDATLVQKLTDGRPAYARAVVAAMRAPGGMTRAFDPVKALAAVLAPQGALSGLCCHSYELRLHRARGYGALKAILDILAWEEPLTLTEVAQRLGRTPGSTKDYLSWLEDVDLVSVSQKRYRFRDPVLRVWCRLHCRPSEPGAEEIAREVHEYAASLGATVAAV